MQVLLGPGGSPENEPQMRIGPENTRGDAKYRLCKLSRVQLSHLRQELRPANVGACQKRPSEENVCLIVTSGGNDWWANHVLTDHRFLVMMSSCGYSHPSRLPAQRNIPRVPWTIIKSDMDQYK